MSYKNWHIILGMLVSQLLIVSTIYIYITSSQANVDFIFGSIFGDVDCPQLLQPLCLVRDMQLGSLSISVNQPPWPFCETGASDYIDYLEDILRQRIQRLAVIKVNCLIIFAQLLFLLFFRSSVFPYLLPMFPRVLPQKGIISPPIFRTCQDATGCPLRQPLWHERSHGH